MDSKDNFGHEAYLMHIGLDIFNDAGVWQYEKQLHADDETGELIAPGHWDDSMRDAVTKDMFNSETDKDGNFKREATHEDVFYHLLNMYVSLYWEVDDEHLRLLTIKSFEDYSQKYHKTPLSFNEIKTLIKKHWRKPKVSGLTEKKVNLFPKTAGNYYKDMVEDYIAMMHELELPVVNEEKIHDIKNRGMAFQDFWWLYCTMAKALREPNQWYEPDLFTIGLGRFKEKVGGTSDILFPMLSILFDHYSSNEAWVKKMMGDNDGKGQALSKIGYSSIMFARRMLYPEELSDNASKYRDDDRAWYMVTAWEQLKRTWEDYLEKQGTQEGTFDNFGSYLKANWESFKCDTPLKMPQDLKESREQKFD